MFESLELSQSEKEIFSIFETIVNIGRCLDDMKTYNKSIAMAINRKCTSTLIKDLSKLILKVFKSGWQEHLRCAENGI